MAFCHQFKCNTQTHEDFQLAGWNTGTGARLKLKKVYLACQLETSTKKFPLINLLSPIGKEMITADAGYSNAHCAPKYDRKSELKAFDDTKAGVKGLVDAGITKIPRIFIHDQLKLSNSRSGDSEFIIPILDLDGVNKDAISRAKIVKQVQNACQNWGFFQIVNHGIPVSMLDEMIDGVIGFHEQDTEVKKKFYTRDYQKRMVLYNTNFDFYVAPEANWRDTLSCVMAPNPPDPEELPEVCRYVIKIYT